MTQGANGNVFHKGRPVLGIVIPALDEEESLPRLLRDLSEVDLPHRIVVADGGSTDGTRRIAREAGATVIPAPRGRARQMNAGARVLDTPWLLFLHADVRMPGEARTTLVRWMEEAGPREVGWFDFSLQGSEWFWHFLEFGQRLRERWGRLVYGDQGLLVSADLFHEVGGYPPLPLMEDVELFRRLLRVGRGRKIQAPLPSSPRRYQERGRWRGWLRNTALVSLYLAGVPPARLASFYPARRTSENAGPPGKPLDGHPDTLLVFAKEPVPGKVKTRLAAQVGPEKAAAIYRSLGQRVVDQVRGGSYRTVVCFDPPQARDRITEWLGTEALDFAPQVEGDLGDRLAAAFTQAFTVAERVVVVGTDAPEVDAARVEEAFRRLREADLVLGPARDGGYYLLGLKGPVSELFEGVPWSTENVLAVTLEKAEGLGLSTELLPVLSDVDRWEDWKQMS